MNTIALMTICRFATPILTVLSVTVKTALTPKKAYNIVPSVFYGLLHILYIPIFYLLLQSSYLSNNTENLYTSWYGIDTNIVTNYFILLTVIYMFAPIIGAIFSHKSLEKYKNIASTCYSFIYLLVSVAVAVKQLSSNFYYIELVMFELINLLLAASLSVSMASANNNLGKVLKLVVYIITALCCAVCLVSLIMTMAASSIIGLPWVIGIILLLCAGSIGIIFTVKEIQAK
ncbi:MAG: hypothetical protein II306_02580 [Clostridia bacterium]|nr:hypothetical protein [Clostridia bacterium]